MSMRLLWVCLLFGTLACADNVAPGDGGNNTPANNTPANNTPANNTPANNTPANNTPANNTPANNTPTNNDPNNNPNNNEPPPYTPAPDGEVSPLSDTWDCTPDVEVCDARDNDCDGQVDETACTCGSDMDCYSGPMDAAGVGACVFGSRGCDGGEFFGACSGSVAPSPEICGDGIDNDCDGLPDEGCCQVFEECGNRIDDNCNGILDDGCPADAEDTYVIGEDTGERPVDFIMAVDNSESMQDTTDQVEANLDDLATRLAGSGVDYRLILLSSRGTGSGTDICIQQPLAGSGCGNADRFLHVNKAVDSHSAFPDMLACHGGCEGGGYSSFLRPWALTQLIVVSDDNANVTWDDFLADMQQLGFTDVLMHGIVGLRRATCSDAVGDEYIQGATSTGGELVHICDNNWGRVIDVIFEATLTRLQTTFLLAQQPLLGTLRVFVTPNGGVKAERFDGWLFDPVANTIEFLAGNEPQDADTVTVRYEYLL